MDIKEIYQALQKYHSVMSFNKPLDKTELANFQDKYNLKLPDSYIELLLLFNGGEIFIPGTTIYGIGGEENTRLEYANRSRYRNNFHIPNNYLIIAKLNYGDVICIDLNKPYGVIQWDHESDIIYCTWESLNEWLEESIKDYEKYE